MSFERNKYTVDVMQEIKNQISKMQTYKLFSDDNEKCISRDEVSQIIDEKIKECLGMKYTRTKIMETGAFSEFLPKGSKLYMRPELPKVRFKKNGVKYAVTDLHLLNQEAIRVFEIILDTVIDMPNCREVSFNAENADEDTIHIITDILAGMEYSAEKGGKNGFSIDGCFLVTGARKTNDTITFLLAEDHANIIYEYAQENLQDRTISICDLAIVFAEKGLEIFGQK